MANFLKLTVEPGMARLRLSRAVRDAVEVELDECEDGKAELLQQLLSLVSESESETAAPVEISTIQEELTKQREQYELLQKRFEELMSSKEQSASSTTGSLATLAAIPPPQVPQVDTAAPIAPPLDVAYWRREFRIAGSIGGDTQKERISLVSLTRQIETGLQKGHKETEISEAVIRAINPSLKLRSYLEMMPQLSLDRLRQILRVHYKQKSSTELYQELTTACQGTKESPQDFLIRVMDLRQQILFASQIDDSTVKYDVNLVNGLFKHILETGLVSESIRAKIRPLLLDPAATDEQLMEKINSAVSEESERLSKFSGRKVQVNELQLQPSPIEEKKQKPPPEKKGKDSCSPAESKEVMQTLQALQAEVASLRSELKTSQASGGPSTTRGPRRCKKCTEEGVQKCTHCFKCGSDSHFARGCKSGKQGNPQGLQPWDRE